MKKIISFTIILLPVLGFSQKIFEGKITYAAPLPLSMKDSIVMNHYFSPGKIRITMGFINDIDIENYRFIALLDSNIYYSVYMPTRFAYRIIMDTTEQHEKIVRDTLAGELNICGFKCYGIKESLKETPLIDKKDTVSMDVVAWYAKDLYFPYEINRHFSQSSIVYKGHICLFSQGSFNGPLLGNDKMNFTAIRVEYLKNPDSIFQIPSDFKIQTIKLSEFLKE